MDGAALGTRVLLLLGVLCLLLMAADLVFETHGPLAFENWIGFQGAFGFAACAALVGVSGPLRRWSKTPSIRWKTSGGRPNTRPIWPRSLPAARWSRR